MDSINLMMEEHKYIKRMLTVVRNACIGIVQGEDIDFQDFSDMTDFIRNFADAHHHGKEENLLFNRMTDEIGGPAEKLVRHGMLVEHDMGRLFVKELVEALEKVKNGDDNAKVDVVANGVSYANLLSRHIDKEDNVVYTFAKRELSKGTLDKINKECEDFENEKKANSIQERYIKLLENLENKYIK